jgi:hypothetical protein
MRSCCDLTAPVNINSAKRCVMAAVSYEGAGLSLRQSAAHRNDGLHWRYKRGKGMLNHGVISAG